MKATALQTLLGLHIVNLEIRDGIEILAVLVAGLAAVALRRRTLALRSRGFVMIAIGLASDLLVPSFGPGSAAATWLEALALTLFLWAAILLSRQLYDGITRRRRVNFSTIFRDLVSALLYSVTLLAVLRYTVKVDLTSLLAGSAVVAAVIGFGLQEALGNIFNGLTLQMQLPFVPGEWVRLKDQVGQVQGIGWRSTRLITRNKERLEIPNSVVAKDVLTNYATGGVADEVSIGLPYGEPPNRVKELAMEVLGGVPHVLRNPPPEVYAWEFGDFAIKYRIKYWMADYGVAEIVRNEVITRLWYALHRHSIEIPFPIRTIYMHQAQAEGAARVGLEDTILNELRSVELLSSLSDEELHLLTRDMSIHRFARGEMLMHEGEIAQSLHILRHGKVEIVARGADGALFPIRDLIAPDVLGEISLMQGIPRTASVRATTDVEALVVSKEGFARLLKARPELAEEIAKIIAPRMAETEGRIAATHAAVTTQSERTFLARMRQIFDIGPAKH